MAVTGVNETFAKLNHLVNQEFNGAAQAVTAATLRRVQAIARSRCPVSSPKDGPFPGHVRDQIGMQMAGDGSPYGAVFVERAGSILAGHKSPTVGGKLTRSRTVSGKLGRLRWYYGVDNRGLWLEYGTRTRAAHPFMNPAAEAERANYLRELTAAWDRVSGRWR